MIKRLFMSIMGTMILLSGFGQATTPPCICCTEEYKQFDFWIGDWVVYSDGIMVGFNKITKMVETDCVLRESWKSVVSSHSGTSMNYYDKAIRKWRHVWVGNDGIVVDVKGTFKDNKMVMTSDEVIDEKGNRVIQKVTWIKNADGTIRQTWEQSTDGGLAFTVKWDGLYRKRK